MLRKLLKYDLKWCFKPLTIFYVLLVISSILGRVLKEIENSLILNIVGQVCSGFAVGMMVNILINNLIRVWARFIRNMYKDESYLTHTLPVNIKTIYVSKILSAIITMLISAIVILIGLFISYYSKETIESLKTSIELVANYYDSTVIQFIITVGIVLFLEALFGLFAGYIGIILGYKSNNMKIVKSIIFGFISFMIPSVVTLILIYVVGLFNPEIMNLFNTVTTLDIEAIKNVLYGGMVMYIVYICLYYYIGKKLLEKGVNVD